MILFFVIGILLAGDQWLVLTNGKTISIDRFERKGSQVTIYQKDQVFSLPAQLVDWGATQDRNRQEEQAREEKEKLAVKKSVPEAPRKPIVLIDDGRKSSSESQKAAVHYRTLGNSIIVSVTINGSGPYDVLLDTGASMTLIHPDVIDRIRAKFTEKVIPLVGLGGEVSARQAILDSLSLGGASVAQFKVAAHQLPSLTDMGVFGLLGQDFLNHFVMELDSAGKLLTLTPHSGSVAPVDSGDLAEKAREMLEKHRDYSQQLSDVFRRIGELSRQYFNRQAGETTGGVSQELISLSRTLTDIRNFNNHARSLLSEIVDANMADNRDVILQYLSCYGRYDRYLHEAQGFCQILRRGYSRDADDAKMEAQVLEKYRIVEDRYRDYTSCRR